MSTMLRQTVQSPAIAGPRGGAEQFMAYVGSFPYKHVIALQFLLAGSIMNIATPSIR